MKILQLKEIEFDPTLYNLFPPGLLRRHEAIPIRLEEQRLEIAMTRPTDLVAVTALRDALPGLRLSPVACGHQDYLDFLEDVVEPRLARPQSEGPNEFYQADQVALLSQDGKTQGLPDQSVRERLLRQLFVIALNRGANSIHIEPQSGAVRVRLCLDHQWLEVSLEDLPDCSLEGLVLGLKELAGLESEVMKPQSGNGRVRVGGRTLDLRVNTFPTRHGQRLVVWLLESDKLSW